MSGQDICSSCFSLLISEGTCNICNRDNSYKIIKSFISYKDIVIKIFNDYKDSFKSLDNIDNIKNEILNLNITTIRLKEQTVLSFILYYLEYNNLLTEELVKIKIPRIYRKKAIQLLKDLNLEKSLIFIKSPESFIKYFNKYLNNEQINIFKNCLDCLMLLNLCNKENQFNLAETICYYIFLKFNSPMIENIKKTKDNKLNKVIEIIINRDLTVDKIESKLYK